MGLIDNFKARTGLFAPDADEGSAEWSAEPANIDQVDADEPDTPIGDADSKVSPPPPAAMVPGAEL